MPNATKTSQLEAQQPATTYAEFKHEILNEIARCLNMPFNVAAGNSSGYNYACGRLDHQTYFKAIRVEQAHLEAVVLDRILAAWFDKAAFIPGFLPAGLGPIATWPHQWFWDGHEHIDPAKEAAAQATRLANHTTTLAHEYARHGRDWEEALRQRAKELALMQELGLTATLAGPTPNPTTRNHSMKPPNQMIRPTEERTLNLLAAAVELEAAPADGDAQKLRRCTMTAYTGGAMPLAGWRYPVVVDLHGLDLGRQRRLILLDHQRDVDFVLGQTDSVAVLNDQLIVAGHILGDSPKARQVIALNDRGFAWQASIGARAEQVEFVAEGKTAQANGREFAGPVNIVRRATLGEISFVVLGADENTLARSPPRSRKATWTPRPTRPRRRSRRSPTSALRLRPRRGTSPPSASCAQGNTPRLRHKPSPKAGTRPAPNWPSSAPPGRKGLTSSGERPTTASARRNCSRPPSP
ncbi:MAG: hypothetical protein RMI91_11950 [Gemmatales bacterium]|nr:hypothetical protein [Gemmatales bacterium]MDW7995353.1 hypothetical protein [Gemmatales bacterium]